MPKALSPFADEDEKTTIENGWEEEASTTVEQGEVAEKIRTLGLRPITNVTGAMDEPTVDDQRANAALSLITPAAVHARLIITAGNDQGQEIEVIPGKSYTIGRAIDNDIVLTDIAVSRKHFDLRYENNAWVLADRGSGNGTLVNGNIEDNPFMLANGDAIEIGNTTFRFDHPHGIPRNSFNDLPQTNGFNHTGDIVTRNADAFDMDEEPSTVAGKPLRHHDDAPPALNSSVPMRPRPKTVPPPAPLPRTKQTSRNMPAGYPVGSALGSVPPIPSNGMPPLPSPPLASQPAMLGMHPPMSSPAIAPPVPSLAPHHPTMLAQSQPEPLAALANVMPTTIPGQGPPVHPSQPQLHSLPFTYPNVADHQQLARQLAPNPGRDATATAHVPPTPYNGLVMQPYVAPQMSRRTKLLLGGAGLTVLAAIATIAIIKGVSGGSDEQAADPQTETPSKPTSQPIEKDKKVGESKDGVANKQSAQTKNDDDNKAKIDEKAKKDAEEKKRKDEEKAAQAKKDAEEKKRKDEEKAAQLAQLKRDAEEKKANQAKALADQKARALADAKARADAKAKADAQRLADAKAKADAARRANDARKKQVAVAKVDFTGPKEQAKQLYQAKKFNDAARVLRAAVGNTSGAEASQVRNTAAAYEIFGRAYFNALNGGNAIQSWNAINQALTYDNTLGGIYVSELTQKRTQIAGKAAIALVGAKSYAQALVAIKMGEAAGSSDAKLARQSLESDARELLKQARSDKDSDPKTARTKANQVKSMVGPGTPLYEKADKLLATISG